MALQPPSAAARLSKPIIAASRCALRSRKEGQDMTAVDVVIMAAGKGTRMKSQRPKVLHRLAGRALVDHVIDCASALQARRIVLVTGHGADQVEAAVKASASARS